MAKQNAGSSDAGRMESGSISTGSVHSTDKRAGIRPLRSWSSADRSAAAADRDGEGRGLRDIRRFSVAGPASSGSGGGGGSSGGSRSLHTWAEEDEGMAGSVPAARANIQVARRALGDGAFTTLESGSSGSSSQHTGSSSGGGGRHRRLRTPYSISIPSVVGSPLSFTQSFLASRTSMYGKHPPSSQMRAAHIDWDSVSAMDGPGSKSRRGPPHAPRPHMPAVAPGLPYQYLQGLYAGQGPLAHPPPLHPPLPQPAPHAHAPHHVAGPAVPLLSDDCIPMQAAGDWGRQAAWDYACGHHPLLASFSVPLALRLSTSWRCTLLCVIAASVVCVVVGTPVALAVLLAHEAQLVE
ncbi:hypothetical protein GGF46_004723 [Coemansia sp. RSA 552]|nr:hypothetical protein GGF46_004723 [Coemansia sp. RSA 552]